MDLILVSILWSEEINIYAKKNLFRTVVLKCLQAKKTYKMLKLEKLEKYYLVWSSYYDELGNQNSRVLVKSNNLLKNRNFGKIWTFRLIINIFLFGPYLAISIILKFSIKFCYNFDFWSSSWFLTKISIFD